jgi:hypothetical protein
MPGGKLAKVQDPVGGWSGSRLIIEGLGTFMCQRF